MTHLELLKFAQALLAENMVFRRENSILRHELKIRLVNEFLGNYEMTEDEADQAAEREVTGIVLHNEGAE